jgi:hypothetical protein
MNNDSNNEYEKKEKKEQKEKNDEHITRIVENIFNSLNPHVKSKAKDTIIEIIKLLPKNKRESYSYYQPLQQSIKNINEGIKNDKTIIDEFIANNKILVNREEKYKANYLKVAVDSSKSFENKLIKDLQNFEYAKIANEYLNKIKHSGFKINVIQKLKKEYQTQYNNITHKKKRQHARGRYAFKIAAYEAKDRRIAKFKEKISKELPHFKHAVNAMQRITNENNINDIMKNFIKEQERINELRIAKEQAKKDLVRDTLMSEEELRNIRQHIESAETVNQLKKVMEQHVTGNNAMAKHSRIRLNMIKKLREIKNPPKRVMEYLASIDSGQVDSSKGFHPIHIYSHYGFIKSKKESAITFLKKQKEANPTNTNANDAIQLIESHAEFPHTIMSDYRIKRIAKEKANEARKANEAKTKNILLIAGPLVVIGIISAILVFTLKPGSGFRNMNETEINPVTVMTVILLIILFVLIWSK